MSLVIKTTGWTRTLETKQDFEDITREILGDSLAHMNEIEIRDGYKKLENKKSILPQKGGNRFVINIFATPSKNPTFREDLHVIWGYPMKVCGSGGLMYEPSGDGLVIVEPKTGNVVAELIGDNLYFLFGVNSDCCSVRESRNAIYRQILSEAVKLLRLDLPTLEQCQQGDFQPVDPGLLRRIKDANPTNRTMLEQHMAQRGELDRQFSEIMSDTGESEKVIKLIANIPEIRDLEIKDGKLILFTHTMYALDGSGKQLYEFGEFRVTLNFGDKADASFKNLTRRPDLHVGFRPGTYGHPHVDRSGGYWCQGEGSGIIKLLQNFEFEAAVLFAIKAIDSVNGDGDYQSILRIFPKVISRMEYPKKKLPLSASTLAAFHLLYVGNSQIRQRSLRDKATKLQNKITTNQQAVLRGTFAVTLETLEPRQIAQKIEDQLARLRTLKEVQGVRVQGSVLHVGLEQFELVDVTTDQKYLIGPLRLEFNTRDGSVGLINPHPIYRDKSGVVHAPQLGVSGKERVNIGQLGMVVPELLGSLEFVTAVSVTITYLREFDGRKISPQILEAMEKMRVAEKVAL